MENPFEDDSYIINDDRRINNHNDNNILKNRDSLNKIFFTINDMLETEVMKKCGIPDWGSMVFGLFNEALRKKLIEVSKSNKGYHNFILGVKYEYGIDCDIDIKKSFEYYKISATEFKNPFGLHKLYTIFCYQNKKFNVERNREIELFYLFKSIAYSDASLFINNDSFFKIDIAYEISLIIKLEEDFYEKLRNLFENSKCLENNEDELIFIECVFSLKFLNDKQKVSYSHQMECINKLKKLAEKKHLESCYKLAVVYKLSKISPYYNLFS
jgi:hypothetical protein